MFTLQNYIVAKGAPVVAKEMGVEEATVSAWKLFKSAPRPHLASALVRMTNGLLTWEGIYQPFVDHNNEKQLEFDFGTPKEGSKC
jgi:hypothetical protein